MIQIQGTYQSTAQENMEEYCTVLGMPYLARKMTVLNRPILEIRKSGRDNCWTIYSSSFIRKTQVTFELGKEYEEVCFDNNWNTMESITIMKNNYTLESRSYDLYDVVVTKTYEFTEDGCILTMKHKESGTTAKRYFKRLTPTNNEHCS